MAATPRPTLADVARLSGLSKTAVSLILNDRPSRLSADAVERVRPRPRSSATKPNPAAQSLRSGKTRSIGFISDQVTITRFASAMVRGTLRAAKELEHTVLIAETGDDGPQLAAAFDEMIHRRVDGVIVGLMAARMVDVPRAPHGVPVVIVNGRTPDDLPSVLPDEYVAGHAMASVAAGGGAHPRRLHRRRPAHRRRSSPIRHDRAPARRASATPSPSGGWRRPGVEVEDWKTAIGFTQTHRMLDAHPDLTAFIAATDGVAFGVYQALADRGLSIPSDISVVSFDDEELASLVRPGLTTARLPYEQMARLGVEMLLGERDLAHELLPMPVIALWDSDALDPLRARAAPSASDESAIAPSSSGERNEKPASTSACGATLLLFSTSCDSVPSTAMPGSSIQRQAGIPTGMCTARRRERISSRFGTATGAAMFTAPATSSWSRRNRIASTKSHSWIQENICRPCERTYPGGAGCVACGPMPR